jgi:hypothetical protein
MQRCPPPSWPNLHPSWCSRPAHTRKWVLLGTRQASRSLPFCLCGFISHAFTGALLSAIIEGTERADLVGSGLGDLSTQMQQLDRTSWPTTIEELGQYFHILLFIPFEVFKGENAATLARRALLTDQAASHSSNPLSFSTLATRVSCRLFASRCLQDPRSSFTDYVSSSLTAAK